MSAGDARRPYLHYGCGLCAPAGWRNFDASPSLRLARLPVVGGLVARAARLPEFPANVEYGDVVRGLPVAPGSCRAAYCSHVLEHLALEDLRAALANTRRYLAPDGVFRLVVPDLEQLARAYLSSPGAGAAPDFMRATRLGRERRPRGPAAIARALLGHSEHRWMWDYASLRAELERAGFDRVRRARRGDARDPGFAEVEEEARWRGALGIECRRPAAPAEAQAHARAPRAPAGRAPPRARSFEETRLRLYYRV